jgi:hypothetical protein
MHRPSRGGASCFSRLISPDPPREIEYVIKREIEYVIKREIAIANHHAKKKNAAKKGKCFKTCSGYWFVFDGYFENKKRRTKSFFLCLTAAATQMNRFVQISTDLTDWANKFNRFGQTSFSRV